MFGSITYYIYFHEYSNTSYLPVLVYNEMVKTNDQTILANILLHAMACSVEELAEHPIPAVHQIWNLRSWELNEKEIIIASAELEESR